MRRVRTGGEIFALWHNLNNRTHCPDLTYSQMAKIIGTTYKKVCLHLNSTFQQGDDYKQKPILSSSIVNSNFHNLVLERRREEALVKYITLLPFKRTCTQQS